MPNGSRSSHIDESKPSLTSTLAPILLLAGEAAQIRDNE